MSDYRVFNDNGYERTWEELYEDNISFQKYTDKLEQENKELKLELSGYRQAILKDKEMLGLKEENDKLKKQLENKYEKVGTLTSELLYEENTKLINQQKEFIEYLENMLDNENDIFSVVRVKDVLQKYKEIIGVSDENNIK